MPSVKTYLRRWILGERIFGLIRQGPPPDLRLLRRDVKVLGYELGRRLGAGLRTASPAGEPRIRDLGWRACRQADMESPWFAHWCAELRLAPVFHRKLWELAYVLQAFHDAGVMREGARGLGFGCGEEPIASYLAARGVEVVVTDLDPERSRGRGWMESGQHTSAVDKAYRPELVSREVFDRRVRLEYVDMNDVPAHLEAQHDFCWSICAFEHLGSIEQGLRFVERSLDTLRPGGVAVHTSEYAYADGDPRVDRGPTVLFRRADYQALAERLRGRGYQVGEADYDPGSAPLDRFVDLPPFAADGSGGPGWEALPGEARTHLKLLLDGAASTCFALVVRKPAAG